MLQEEEHEWGVNVGGNEPQSLEYAPRRWRVALAAQRMVLAHVYTIGILHSIRSAAVHY